MRSESSDVMRDRLIESLRLGRDGFVTGEELSKSLGVSRTAIWKHVESLRRRGYSIEASPRRGYRLVGVPDVLYPWELRRGLGTTVVGSKWVHLYETESTMDVAGRLAEEGCPEGTVVISEFQRSGRGRLGRSWICPPSKGIIMSVVFRPVLPPKAALRFTFFSALAVRRVIEEEAGLNARIKWPNDVLIGSKKVCGILTEMAAESDELKYVIVGIGLNVNSHRSDFPGELREVATSLADEAGNGFSRINIARRLLEELEGLYFGACDDFGSVLREWKEHCVTLGNHVTVASPWEDLCGFAEDIDDDGALIISLPDGSMRRVVAGDVSYHEGSGYLR